MAQENNQTEDFARNRASQVSDLHYDLHYDLSPGKKTWLGQVTLSFKLNRANEDLVVDFSGESVNKVKLNQKTIENFVYSKEQGRITIPASHLKEGKHELLIDYEGRYVTNGQGFHRFIDPADNLEYYYTHLEPNDAHRFFPCFDQPDLKATYKTSVLAPNDWVIVSNGPVIKEARMGDKTRTDFKKTKPFSTYITQLSAGPFASFHDTSFRYPLSIYCRQSLARYMDADYMFETTRKGFDYFEDYFDYPYPFEKYDQIFCPEYNIGAMENVGAVTFNEGYLYTTKPTRANLLRRDITILHEMAHMWFGDLVTMVWWNDLWLKESFATYMSYLALEGIGVENVWSLATGSKTWAQHSDQNPNTHPILADVPDVRAAASIFDGITYGKGFAVLHQLDTFLGGNVFRDGLRAYFKEHEWGNTDLDDFMASLEKAANKDLDHWVDVWLAKMGMNTMELTYDIRDGKITSPVILQKPSEFNDILRPHATQLGLYDLVDGTIKLRKTLRVVYEGPNDPVKELQGIKAPAFILPNMQGADFINSHLDEHSLKWVRENMDLITDKDTKTQIWRMLWSMLRDHRIETRDVFELALKRIPKETDPDILGTLSGYLQTISWVYIAKSPERDRVMDQVNQVANKALMNAKAGSDLQRTYWGLFQGTCNSDSSLKVLEDIFTGKKVIEGLPMTYDTRWEILRTIAYRQSERAIELGEALAKEDNSSSGSNSLLAIKASQPNKANKESVWKALVNGGNGSMRQTFSMAEGFYNTEDDSFTKPFVAPFFDTVLQVYKEQEYAYAKRFVEHLYPRIGNEDAAKQTRAFLSRDDVPKPLRSMLVGSLDFLERALAMQKRWK